MLDPVFSRDQWSVDVWLTKDYDILELCFIKTDWVCCFVFEYLVGFRKWWCEGKCLFSKYFFRTSSIRSTVSSKAWGRASVLHRGHWSATSLFTQLTSDAIFIFKARSSLAVLCLAIGILVYVFNTGERRGRTGANHKQISCSTDCHGFVTYTRMTIEGYEVSVVNNALSYRILTAPLF